MTTAQQQTNEQALTALERDYPEAQWSESRIDSEGEIDVTFQRYSDDAEDRYVIRDGKATLI